MKLRESLLDLLQTWPITQDQHANGKSAHSLLFLRKHPNTFWKHNITNVTLFLAENVYEANIRSGDAKSSRWDKSERFEDHSSTSPFPHRPLNRSIVPT